MLKVGLTGGIACGKTHVARRLAAHGVPVIDLDTVAHAVLAPGGSAHHDVVEAFGPEVLAPDRTIDRKALGRIVFADQAARLRLNAIVHPRIRAEEVRLAAAVGGDAAVVVVDAALLVETGQHLRFDRLAVAHCSPEQQAARLQARDGLSAADALARIAAQMPVAEKRRFANLEVDTSGRPENTDERVDALAAGLRAIAQAPPPRPPLDAGRLAGLLAAAGEAGPLGLTSTRLLEAVLEHGGLELDRLGRLLPGADSGPWYAATRPGTAVPGWTLGPALAGWALVRRGLDEEFASGAAFSLGRLLALPAAAQAELVYATLRALAALAGERAEGRPPAWRALAARWTGAEPDPGSLPPLAESRPAPPALVELVRRLAALDR